MQFDPGATAIILTFVAAQTGALIFFAGVVSRVIKDHDRRHDETEARVETLADNVSLLQGEMKGLQL
jgi:hypothetical protein